jgi:hypothetical protein
LAQEKTNVELWASLEILDEYVLEELKKVWKVWKVSDFFDFPKFQNPAIAEFHSPGLQLLGLHQLLQLRPSLFFISSKNSNAMWGMTLSWLVVSRVGAEKLVSVVCPILMI